MSGTGGRKILIGMRMEELMLGGQGQLRVQQQIVAHGRMSAGTQRRRSTVTQQTGRRVKQLAQLVQRRSARIQAARVEVGQQMGRRRQRRTQTDGRRLGRQQTARRVQTGQRRWNTRRHGRTGR